MKPFSTRKLHVAAVILNQVSAMIDSDMDNAADLKSYCASPLFRCGFNQELAPMFDGNRA
jgi:hypothetical protein